jgi:hypothetical protein
MQSVIAGLAAGEREFAGHSKQSESPVFDLYVPDGHCTHMVLSAPRHPALQTQPALGSKFDMNVRALAVNVSPAHLSLKVSGIPPASKTFNVYDLIC